MSDPISLEAAIKLILSGRVGADSLVECPEECNSMLEWAADEVAKMPTAEKKGYWVYKKYDEKTGIEYHEFCSECGFPRAQIYDEFCAVCGARMRG